MSDSADLDVGYVAKLARLQLSDEETALFQNQLGDILEYVDKLREADVPEADGTSDVIPKKFNVFREDEPRDWFTAEEALSNAPRQRDHLFIVPKVVE
jgi:aspartyl-tRNA(Asn)/glutamyl-tRNA(Gln) amidotransferase subunit C